MFLTLAHTKLDVYNVTRLFVKECYSVSKLLPVEERYNMAQQLKRAVLSIQLNIAEGSSRKSNSERNRYYEIARGSLIEIDSIMDAGEDLNYWNKTDLEKFGDYMIRVFMMLSKMISHSN